jgi:hypothetical protein
MQYIIIGKQKNKIISDTLSMKNQELWRQKQIDIYFRSGRPIFKNMDHYKTVFGLYRK